MDKCSYLVLRCAAQGIAMIRLLRQLEQRTGRRIHELFDLVAGTSTGGILAVALALKHFTLEECEDIYRRASCPNLQPHNPQCCTIVLNSSS